MDRDRKKERESEREREREKETWSAKLERRLRESKVICGCRLVLFSSHYGIESTKI